MDNLVEEINNIIQNKQECQTMEYDKQFICYSCKITEIERKQGSNLGPLLFIIYMNTAPKAIHSSTTVQLYADDMKCFRIIDNINDVQQLQSDLLNLNNWSADHFMKFNSKKCKYLAITRKKNIVISTHTT